MSPMNIFNIPNQYSILTSLISPFSPDGGPEIWSGYYLFPISTAVVSHLAKLMEEGHHSMGLNLWHWCSLARCNYWLFHSLGAWVGSMKILHPELPPAVPMIRSVLALS